LEGDGHASWIKDPPRDQQLTLPVGFAGSRSPL